MTTDLYIKDNNRYRFCHFSVKIDFGTIKQRVQTRQRRRQLSDSSVSQITIKGALRCTLFALLFILSDGSLSCNNIAPEFIKSADKFALRVYQHKESRPFREKPSFRFPSARNSFFHIWRPFQKFRQRQSFPLFYNRKNRRLLCIISDNLFHLFQRCKKRNRTYMRRLQAWGGVNNSFTFSSVTLTDFPQPASKIKAKSREITDKVLFFIL